MSILIFILVSYVLLSFSLRPLFVKAGVPSWKALVPGLNFVEWSTIVGQPRWWAILLLIPIVNIFIYAGLAVDMVRSFKCYKFWHSALAVIYAPLMFFLVDRDKDASYDGPVVPKERDYKNQLKAARNSKDLVALNKLSRSPFHKTGGREWIESVVFAVFAAAFIRMFLIEAYMIPTPSMEGSLLVGDYLFVSKAHYGIRPPMTVLQIPLLHNRIPIADRESYLRSPSLPYWRLPSITPIKRNDPVVFNYPDGDSVYITKERTYSYHDMQRVPNFNAERSGITLTTRPVDKKDHYIKRCVGVPGDTLEIKDRQVYINGKPGENPENLLFTYSVASPNGNINKVKLQEWGVNMNEIAAGASQLSLSSKQVEQVKSLGEGIEVNLMESTSPFPNYYFPHDEKNFPGWTADNFGPIYIPKAGVTIPISTSNIAMYHRIIEVFENHDLEIKGNEIFIDGAAATSYTFDMNYFWMMGDNRHNSEDSRVWGFVPEDHIVGKPLFIWMSTVNGSLSNGIRWDRLFTSALR